MARIVIAPSMIFFQRADQQCCAAGCETAAPGWVAGPVDPARLGDEDFEADEEVRGGLRQGVGHKPADIHCTSGHIGPILQVS